MLSELPGRGIPAVKAPEAVLSLLAQGNLLEAIRQRLADPEDPDEIFRKLVELILDNPDYQDAFLLMIRASAQQIPLSRLAQSSFPESKGSSDSAMLASPERPKMF